MKDKLFLDTKQCTILYTEDLQHNQIIEGKLKIVNPF
jgi:predicted nucleic acid-binding protein